MDEKSSQIIDDIESTRDRLGSNLSDLESRMRQATNWRTYYQRHPLMFVGAAIGGGFLVSKVFTSSGGGGNGESHSHRYESSSGEKGAAGEIIDKVKTALVVYGTAKAKEMLGEFLPGFNEHVHNL